jgi:hypothetical protein
MVLFHLCIFTAVYEVYQIDKIYLYSRFFPLNLRGGGLSFVKSFGNIIIITLFSIVNALFLLYFNYCLYLSPLHGNKNILSLWFNVFIILQLVFFFCVIGTYFCSDHKPHHVILSKHPELSCIMRSQCLHYLSSVANSKVPAISLP